MDNQNFNKAFSENDKNCTSYEKLNSKINEEVNIKIWQVCLIGAPIIIIILSLYGLIKSKKIVFKIIYVIGLITGIIGLFIAIGAMIAFGHG